MKNLLLKICMFFEICILFTIVLEKFIRGTRSYVSYEMELTQQLKFIVCNPASDHDSHNVVQQYPCVPPS